MVNIHRIMLINLCLLLLLASSAAIAAEPEARAGTVKATVLWFSEQESYTDSYPVRMIITPDYLRIDEGSNEDLNFVLFDRNTSIIYSTDSERKNYLKVVQKPVTIDSPIPLNIARKELAVDDSAPRLNGKQAKNYHLLVNDKVCYELVTIDDFQQEALKALSEYRQVLAGEHAAVLGDTPADLQNPCDLAIHTFEPALIYQQGFPILERDATGYVRVLVNFEEKEISDSLFVLPEGFVAFEI